MAIKIEDFINEIKNMKVSELNELVKAIETEFGVSATAVAAPVAAGGSGEESSEKTVELTSGGSNKIAVIKVVREVLGLGLMDAKKFVDEAPQIIKESVSVEQANELEAKFKEAGATITLK